MSERHSVVYLIRHGETPWHGENRYCGLTDLPLTEKGVRQAESLAEWAATAGLAAVYSSTLSRAVATAAPSARAAGVPHRKDTRLVELDFGKGEGLTSAEMESRFPRDRAAFVADPVANPLPGGEDPHAAIARGRAAVEEIVAAHPGEKVLVVCHSTLLRLVTCHLAGILPARYRRVFPKVANTSGAVLRYSPDAAADEGEDSPGLGVDGWGLLAFNPELVAGA